MSGVFHRKDRIQGQDQRQGQDRKQDQCKSQFKVLMALALGFSSFACSSQPRSPAPSDAQGAGAKTSATESAPASWHGKMQSLSVTLSSLLPMVSSPRKFNDPKNQAQIDEDTQALRKLTHSLKGTQAPNADPTMQIVSGLFDEDITRAQQALRTGNRDYARHILKDTTSYCIQCHTQSQNGPNFPFLQLNIDTSQLTSLEQAEFFAATRQFDRALESYVSALSGPELAKKDPFEWETAARTALAITVRVKNDPKEARALIQKIKPQAKRLPRSSQKALSAWERSVKEWAATKAAPPQSASDRLAFAARLIQSAQAKQDFQLDHTQDIPYFRASSLLHNLLQEQTPADKGGLTLDERAQALYYAGLTAEATRDLNFWTLHETYYEQCIRLKPDSGIAQRCYDRLKESVTLGYSGSAGTSIPPEVAKRLECFKSIAKKPAASATEQQLGSTAAPAAPVSCNQ